MSTVSVAPGTKVYVTRRVPQVGIDTLRAAGCTVTHWDSDDPVPKDELVRNINGCSALFCMLTDRIDKDVLDSAG